MDKFTKAVKSITPHPTAITHLGPPLTKRYQLQIPPQQLQFNYPLIDPPKPKPNISINQIRTLARTMMIEDGLLPTIGAKEKEIDTALNKLSQQQKQQTKRKYRKLVRRLKEFGQKGKMIDIDDPKMARFLLDTHGSSKRASTRMMVNAFYMAKAKKQLTTK